MLKLGSSNVKKLYLGSAEVKKVYLGNVAVYMGDAPTNIATNLGILTGSQSAEFDWTAPSGHITRYNVQWQWYRNGSWGAVSTVRTGSPFVTVSTPDYDRSADNLRFRVMTIFLSVDGPWSAWKTLKE